MTRIAVAIAIPALIVCAPERADAQPFQFVAAALSGQPLPGGGATYSSFGIPVINDAGQVAFAGTDSTGAQFAVAGPPGALDLRVRSGMAAPPGVGPGMWGGTQDPFITSDGRIGFYGAVVTPQSSIVRGLYLASSATQASVVADSGANTPPHPAGTIVTEVQRVGVAPGARGNPGRAQRRALQLKR